MKNQLSKTQFSRGRIIAVAIATVIGMGVAGGFMATATQDDDADVYVYFTDASPLIKGNDVKAAGVKVGTISSIDVDGGRAKVGLALDDAVLPLHRDATALVRPVGLLGERYVELDRGTPKARELADGGVIEVEQTGRATDLDEVLNMVDAPTGTALAMLLTTLGEGLQGQGKNADEAIKALAPALQDTDRLGQILSDQNTVLARLLDSVEPIAAELGTERGARLDRLVAAADDALGATAANDRNLDGTLAALPGALDETTSTLAALRGAADSTTPVLSSVRPVTGDLRQLSKELREFSQAARPALDSLDPLLDEATVLLERARPVARSLSALSPDMRATASQGREIATSMLDELDTVLEFMRNWALTTNGQDGLSHYFRAHVVATTEIAQGLLPNGEDVIPDLPEIPLENADDLLEDPLGTLTDIPGLVDDLGNTLGGLTGQGGKNNQNGSNSSTNGGLLGGLLGGNRSAAPAAAPRSSEPGSVTGLSATQEENLMSYLIGGE